MKIALVFDGLQIGGIERVGSDYASLLRELGHDVTVINLRPSLTKMESLFPGDVKIEHLSYSRKLSPEQYAKLIRMNDWGRYIYPVASFVLNIVNFFYKIISKRHKFMREHYDLVIAFSGHYNDLTFVAKNYLKSEKKLCWLHGALYSYLLTSDGFVNLYRKIKNLVVLVDEAQEEILAYNPFLKLNITKLYNPIRITKREVNDGTVRGLKEKYGTYILMVSRFSYPHKDQYTVAKALNLVREKYHDDINLVFVGDGPEEEKVKECVSASLSRSKDHIFFEGARDNVQDYYKGAKLLVHASVAGEGLPTIILEAMAYDLPSVVTDSKTGPREILGDNEYGLLCRIQDPDDMAEKIHELLNDEKLYDEYKAKCRERIKDFRAETIKGQLESLLERL